jgi:drug/metabolite transporter (DMT)-like permease
MASRSGRWLTGVLHLWIPATLAAAAAQTARNAMQRRLTETLGTVGATQVRFLYGFPFALLFLPLVLAVSAEDMASLNGAFLWFVAAGAVSQILATALMLAAMRERSFALVTAYIKTEPVQVALFGLAVLGDPLTLGAAVAIAVATAGVLLASGGAGMASPQLLALRPALLGIAAGAFFALASVAFRGAALSLPSGSPLVRATTTLVWSLGLQTVLLAGWLALFDRGAMIGSLRQWRASLTAGFLGALASQFWFIGFALTSAANVRTLALVEVPFAYGVSFVVFGQRASPREMLGMALIVIGVALLLALQ